MQNRSTRSAVSFAGSPRQTTVPFIRCPTLGGRIHGDDLALGILVDHALQHRFRQEPVALLALASRRRIVVSAIVRKSKSECLSLRMAKNRTSPIAEAWGAIIGGSISGGRFPRTKPSFSATICRSARMSVPHFRTRPKRPRSLPPSRIARGDAGRPVHRRLNGKGDQGFDLCGSHSVGFREDGHRRRGEVWEDIYRHCRGDIQPHRHQGQREQHDQDTVIQAR